MADFNYKILTNLTSMTAASGGLFVNTAATASYVRQIILHNVTSSVEQVQLWLTPATQVAADAYKFFNYTLSGSTTFIADMGIPGLMLTQSNASISGSCTDDSKINIMIIGGSEQ